MKRNLIFTLTLVGALSVNIAFMHNGVFNITPNLYYIPVLLGVFNYEKKGVYLSFLTSFLYFATVLMFNSSSESIISTFAKCIVLIVIALLAYHLIKRNKTQESKQKKPDKNTTKMQKAEIELLKEKKWLETTLLSIGDGMIATDVNGIVRMVNKEAENITGYNKKIVIGRNITDVFKIYGKRSNLEINIFAKDIMDSGGGLNLEDKIYYLTKSHQKIDLDIKASAAMLLDQTVLGYVVIFRDVTERKKDEAKIIYLTYHDKLTGLYNRRFFEEEIKRVDVERNLPISVIIGDVNGLKLTNDAFGHHAGDDLLISVANVMRGICRKNEIVARWGGDEFSILLPNTSEEDAEQISQRIRKRCSEEHVSNINLSVSLGVATKTNQDEDIVTIVRQADDKMYKSKLPQSRKMKSKAVQSILNTLYEKNDKEEEHSNRVSELCGEIGQAMNLDQTQIRDLNLLGKLHDIGKISIDENILNKRGKLTPEEYEIVKLHPEKGYHIVSASTELSYLAGSVLAHHERWDGHGYPNGLNGGDIPLMAGILAVADAFEAMTDERPYRKAMSQDEAIDQLVKCAGTQFDPEIVDALVQLLRPSNSFQLEG